MLYVDTISSRIPAPASRRSRVLIRAITALALAGLTLAPAAADLLPGPAMVMVA